MEFIFPLHFKRRTDDQEMISMINTAKSTLCGSFKLTINDIKSMMSQYSSNMIILVYSSNVKRSVYDDLVLHMSQDYIVVISKIDDTVLNQNQSNIFIMNILNQLNNISMIQYRTLINIKSLILLGHRSSCQYLLSKTFTEAKNKIIFIDPVLTSTQTIQKDIISVIMFTESNNDTVIRQKIEALTSNTYTLQGTDPDKIFASPTSDLSELNNRSDHVSRLCSAIDQILKDN